MKQEEAVRFIYGAGAYGKALYEYFMHEHIEVKGFIQSCTESGKAFAINVPSGGQMYILCRCSMSKSWKK